MDHNPYTPPSTTVADVEQELDGARPRAATVGIRILWVITILNCIGTIVSVISQAALVAAGSMMGVVLVIAFIMVGIIFGLMFWFLWAAGKGRNWGRIVLTVLMVIGILWVMFSTVLNFGAAPVQGVISVISLVLQITAIVLLYVRESNAWYAANRK